LLSKINVCDVNFTQSISQQLSEVLQICTDAQQKLLFEVIIPYSSAVWHKTRPAALNKRSHAAKPFFTFW